MPSTSGWPARAWARTSTFSEMVASLLSITTSRLRMRHVAWQIGPRERDAWLSHMLPAVARLDVPEDARAAIWDHVERAAHSLVNWPRGDGDSVVAGPDLS